MKVVLKDDFYYKSELSKSNNTLLIYANSLLGHFDGSETLDEILGVLSGDTANIETDLVFCKIETSSPCRLDECETEDSLTHCYMDCTLVELVSLFYGKEVKFDIKTEQSDFNTLLSVVLQYGVYNKKTFSSTTSLDFDSRIESIKIIYKSVKEHKSDDVMTFISHLYFV